MTSPSSSTNRHWVYDLYKLVIHPSSDLRSVRASNSGVNAAVF